MLSVHDLRKRGLKVKVRHNRNFVTKDMDFYDFDPCGGSTEVEIFDPKTRQSYVGTSLCSRKDNYSRKLGVKIALGRALKSMEF